MSKQFLIFLGVGVAVVAAIIGFAFISTKSAHLELKGSILKVRVLALNPNASLVVVDFRVTNPSGVPFVLRDVTLKLDPASGDSRDGSPVSKSDVDNVFKYEKLLGSRFNDVLSLQDTVPPGRTLDRMAAARFEVPESAINNRRAIRLHLEDVDGTEAELTEKP